MRIRQEAKKMDTADDNKADINQGKKKCGKNSIIYDVILEDGGSAVMDEGQLEEYLERVDNGNPQGNGCYSTY